MPFGTDLSSRPPTCRTSSLHVEVCEDVWAPIPPTHATARWRARRCCANLSASNITVGKADYRRTLARRSRRATIAAYIYTAAGPGESTTDLAWDGQALICENGDLVAEAERFAVDEQLLYADVDLDRIASDRASDEQLRRLDRTTTASGSQASAASRSSSARRRRARCRCGARSSASRTSRPTPRRRNERCYEVYNIQVHGLETRLRATGIEKVVIGVSGGLDSTHALIVVARAMDRLGLPRENVLAYTMPGFATCDHTKGNAWKLMEALGVTAREIDIRPSAEQMLARPRATRTRDGEKQSTTSPSRTSRRASAPRTCSGSRTTTAALVIGTGDLSELALGWATYGVGDQMSHYAVNASVPKTLISFMLRWVDRHRAVRATTSTRSCSRCSTRRSRPS